MLNDWLKSVDFYATAKFVSPQFFPRYDADGKFLPLYDQVMDIDVGRKETFHRPETIPFLLSVPKGRVGPAPVAIFMHGHSGSKNTGKASSPTSSALTIQNTARCLRRCVGAAQALPGSQLCGSR